MLLTTHILDDMDVLADGVLMLSKGRITYNGTYADFRDSLENRVYEIKADVLTESELTFFKSGVLLSEGHSEGLTVYRIASDTAPSNSQDRFVLTTPTLEDLWNFHQGTSKQ